MHVEYLYYNSHLYNMCIIVYTCTCNWLLKIHVHACICTLFLSSDILWGVVDFGSSLTCLCFVQSNASCVVMVGGCEDGRVTCVKWDGPENAQVTCLTRYDILNIGIVMNYYYDRGYDVPKLVRELKCNTALPPTVSICIQMYIAHVHVVTYFPYFGQ